MAGERKTAINCPDTSCSERVNHRWLWVGCCRAHVSTDGCLDGADAEPQNSAVCGDSDLDSCEDCLWAVFDPSNDGPDFDGDGLCNNGDCVAFDGTVW